MTPWRVRVFAGLVALVGAAAVVAAADRVMAPAMNGELLAARLPRAGFLGGPFVRRPRIVTVTFAADDPAIAGRLRRFGATIARSSWWRDAVDGYCDTGGTCIEDAAGDRAVVLDDPLPADVHAVDVSALLRRHAAAGRFGVLDRESVLLVYLPAGVRLRDAYVPAYCGDGPRAFHRSLRLDGMVVGYAVMPRCGDEALLTGSASHELVEMVTRPDPSRPGFAFTLEAPARGFTAAGTGVVDPCGLVTADTDVVESGFVVRRVWSNRAAAAGQDPCRPSPGDRPYVALAPDRQVVRLVNPGDSVTLSLLAASDRPITTWSVQAIDLTGRQQGDRYVDLDLDRATVAPGDQATLRVTLRAIPPVREVIGLVSTHDGVDHLWPLEVVTR